MRRAAAALAVGVTAAYSFARFRPYAVEIGGDSMAPALLPGDWALATGPGRVRRGDVVVIEHPNRPGLEMVKRVVAVAGDLAPDGRMLGGDELWVEGDRPERSTDSRQFGPVHPRAVKAKVRLVYWPPARRRLV